MKNTCIMYGRNIITLGFLVALIAFALDAFSIIEIAVPVMKSSLYMIIPFMAILSVYHVRKFSSLLIRSAVIVCAIFYFGYFIDSGILNYANSASTWKTQEILYANLRYSAITIEYQMKDVGAFGYKRRTVKIINAANILKIPLPYTQLELSSKEWKKVNILLNEMQIKY